MVRPSASTTNTEHGTVVASTLIMAAMQSTSTTVALSPVAFRTSLYWGNDSTENQHYEGLTRLDPISQRLLIRFPLRRQSAFGNALPITNPADLVPPTTQTGSGPAASGMEREEPCPPCGGQVMKKSTMDTNHPHSPFTTVIRSPSISTDV